MKPPISVRFNVGHPLAKGLVGYWNLREGGGLKVFDNSIFSNTGTLQADTHFIGGRTGLALSFDGVGDYVQMASGVFRAGLITTHDFTIVTVARTEQLANTYGFLSQREGLNDYVWLNFNANRIRLTAKNGGVIRVHIGGDIAPACTDWFQAVVVAKRGDPVVYFNATPLVLVFAICNAGDVSNAAALRIGEEDVNFFAGEISYVMIYNRALVAAEVKELYLRPFCMFSKVSLRDRSIR